MPTMSTNSINETKSIHKQFAPSLATVHVINEAKSELRSPMASPLSVRRKNGLPPVSPKSTPPTHRKIYPFSHNSSMGVMASTPISISAVPARMMISTASSPPSSLSLSSSASSPSSSPPPPLPYKATIQRSASTNNPVKKSSLSLTNITNRSSVKCSVNQSLLNSPVNVSNLNQLLNFDLDEILAQQKNLESKRFTATLQRNNQPMDASLYDAEIEMMNQYLKSLPDYKELDRKLHQKFQECEELYDRLRSRNVPLTKSLSHQNVMLKSTSRFISDIDKSKSTNKPMQDRTDKLTNSRYKGIVYPSIFSQKSDLERSTSNSTVTHTNNLNKPLKEGMIKTNCCVEEPLIEEKTISCIEGITNTGNKKVLNEFWVGNVMSGQKAHTPRRRLWNYEKICNTAVGITGQPLKIDALTAKKLAIFDPTVAKAAQKELSKQNSIKSNKLQKNSSLSQLDSKVRQAVTKEDLYQLMCNEPSSSFNNFKQGSDVSDTIINKVINQVNGEAINKSMSTSYVPNNGAIKYNNAHKVIPSSSKTHIPCYTKNLPILKRSTSNSAILMPINWKTTTSSPANITSIANSNMQQLQYSSDINYTDKVLQTLTQTTTNTTSSALLDASPLIATTIPTKTHVDNAVLYSHPSKGVSKSLSSSNIYGIPKYSPFYAKQKQRQMQAIKTMTNLDTNTTNESYINTQHNSKVEVTTTTAPMETPMSMTTSLTTRQKALNENSVREVLALNDQMKTSKQSKKKQHTSSVYASTDTQTVVSMAPIFTNEKNERTTEMNSNVNTFDSLSLERKSEKSNSAISNNSVIATTCCAGQLTKLTSSFHNYNNSNNNNHHKNMIFPPSETMAIDASCHSNSEANQKDIHYQIKNAGKLQGNLKKYSLVSLKTRGDNDINNSSSSSSSSGSGSDSNNNKNNNIKIFPKISTLNTSNAQTEVTQIIPKIEPITFANEMGNSSCTSRLSELNKVNDKLNYKNNIVSSIANMMHSISEIPDLATITTIATTTTATTATTMKILSNEKKLPLPISKSSSTSQIPVAEQQFKHTGSRNNFIPQNLLQQKSLQQQQQQQYFRHDYNTQDLQHSKKSFINWNQLVCRVNVNNETKNIVHNTNGEASQQTATSATNVAKKLQQLQQLQYRNYNYAYNSNNNNDNENKQQQCNNNVARNSIKTTLYNDLRNQNSQSIIRSSHQKFMHQQHQQQQAERNLCFNGHPMLNNGNVLQHSTSFTAVQNPFIVSNVFGIDKDHHNYDNATKTARTTNIVECKNNNNNNNHYVINKGTNSVARRHFTQNDYEIMQQKSKSLMQSASTSAVNFHLTSSQTSQNNYNENKIMATLGEGTFGRVVKVKDMEREYCLALKIIKNVEKYREAAKLEIFALEKIAMKDPNCEHLCVKMIDWFDYHGHMCIVFEMLGLSVFDFLRENNYEPYPLEQVRHMAYQLCYSVKFLHDNRLTHTDLKPENILFVDSEYTTHYNHKINREVRRVKNTDVRLIDFGSATFDHEHHSTIVSTRHYRAPEVILELGWSQPCDVWSVGCILFELYLGITLFQTHDNREHLAMMERILGQIPYRMARKTKTKYFYHGKLDWDEKSFAGRYVRDHCKPLFRYQMSDSEDHCQLFDLIKKMLEYEPSQRITLGEALRHPFFDKLPPHQRIGGGGGNNGNKIVQVISSGSSSRERSHSLSR